MRSIMDHVNCAGRYLLDAACRGLERRSLQKPGQRRGDARRDDPAGGDLADQLRQNIPDSRRNDPAPKAKSARDPAKGGTAERPLDLWTRKDSSVGSAKP